MRVEFSPDARDDLRTIRNWIARDRPRAAAKMVNALVDAASRLDRHVARYSIIANGDIRRMPVLSYLIFYRVTDRIDVVRILHSARDWPNLLDDPT